MDDSILKALDFIDPATTNYEEWLEIGMALHEEGYDFQVWDDWSAREQTKRYSQAMCYKKWESFGTSGATVKGGTIVQYAKDRGYNAKQIHNSDVPLEWDSTIGYDGYTEPAETQPSAKMLSDYILAVFQEGETVNLVLDARKDDDQKWKPASRGSFYTVEDLLAKLKKYDNDISFAIGDWNKEAGAWIRFNPVDGNGVSDSNISKYRFALVESDTLSINEQYSLYKQLQLPIAALVESGGKSLHAIVHVDAGSLEEYRKRVSYLHETLKNNGLDIDTQNKNPSRLSRLPGVTRNGKLQALVETNVGKSSWAEWEKFINDEADDLPDIDSLSTLLEDKPKLSEELIEGVLRIGHKMLISGPSKAGKSFLMMELCVAIAEGGEWLGFKCRKGKVLYVNLEIDKASCVDRFAKIYKAMQKKPNATNVSVWNLRGKALPIDQLMPKLIARIKDAGYVCVVLDPLYKLLNGDENNASDMAKFCNEFDRLCNETGCSVIYSHHHSKGSQGSKNMMDRASGSGVFARDPDAQLDLLELFLNEDVRNNYADAGDTAWQLEGSLREFKPFGRKTFWFRYPLHVIDDSLQNLKPRGKEDNLAKSSKRTKAADREASMDNAYAVLQDQHGFVKLTDMAEYMNVTDRTLRTYLKDSKKYKNDSGIVTEIDADD